MSFRLEVELTGLALYIVDKVAGKVAVLMPDCRRRRDGKFNSHIDQTPAEPHVGYVRMNLANMDKKYAAETDDNPYRKGPEYELIHRFNREVLEFVGTFGTEPTDFKTFDVPNFNAFAPSLKPIPELFEKSPPEELLMRTTLQGGKLFAEANEDDQWKIPRRFKRDMVPHLRLFASSVTWTRIVESPQVIVRITDFSELKTPAEFPLEPVEPGSKVTVKIANLCAHNPLEWSEMRFRKVLGQDVDFKWLYRLLTPSDGTTYESILLEDELPVPEFIGQLASGSDDCMPGQIPGSVP